MIPISLKFQGLYSYQTEQNIDFNHLTQASIFGIFGPVGSGKSSILEAITFALYGDTDRLNRRDDRTYNMMNLKSDDLYIEFEFKAGTGNNYKVVVKGKRNSKNFSDVKSFDRTAYHSTNNEWIPIEVEKIPEIIGLSYENFKRTIIIPQGRFQEFLQLGNTERTKMMKELFNLNKYDLEDKVKRLERKNNDEIQYLSGQLQQLSDSNPEDLKALKKRLVEIKETLVADNQKLEKEQLKLNLYEKLSGLYQKLEKEYNIQKELADKREYFKLLDKQIKQKEYCQIEFKPLIDQLKTISDKIHKYQNTISGSEKSKKEINEKISELFKKFEPIKKEYQNRDTLKQKANDYEQVIKLISLSEEIFNNKTRVKDGVKVLETTDNKITALKSQRKQCTEEAEKLKSELPDISVLNDIKNWHTENDHHIAESNAIKEELNEVNKQISALKDETIDLFKQHPEYTINKSENYQTFVEKLNNSKTEQNEKLNNKLKSIEHLSVQSKLSDYAKNLKDGHTCPLCGSKNHPEKFNAHEAEQKLLKEKKEAEEIKKRIEIIDELIQKTQQNKTKESHLLGLAEKIAQKQERLLANMNEHQQKFTWSKYKDPKVLSNIIEKARANQIKIDELNIQSEKLLNDVEKEESNIKKFNEGIDKIKHIITSKESEYKTIRGSIKIINPEKLFHHDIQSLTEKKNQFIETYNEISKLYETLNDQLENLSKENEKIAGQIEATEKVLKDEEVLNSETQKMFDEKLESSDYQSKEKIIDILNLQIDTEKDKKRLIDYHQNAHNNDKEIKSILLEIGQQKYDQDAHEKLLLEVAVLQNKIKENNQEQGHLTGKVAEIKKDLTTKKELTKKHQTLKEKADNITILKRLLGSHKFVNYISTVHLQNLCQAANERFYKLTRQKLSLEITEDNNFQVRDFMNGGKTRSVKTLSGGQTFQAALSLALALADNIQKLSGVNENFFFLDEGFGSLDKESLEVVFETLKSLRKENRIVGVISHVEEMQQEIDMHLKVENNEETGSTIYANG